MGVASDQRQNPVCGMGRRELRSAAPVYEKDAENPKGGNTKGKAEFIRIP